MASRKSKGMFASYFTPEVQKQMDLSFGKIWPAILYMLYHYKKTKLNAIPNYDLKVMTGYYMWYQSEDDILNMVAPLIKEIPFTKKTLELTKLGFWYGEVMWKYADILMKTAKKKTLTQILEEKTAALKMTIEEINAISNEEKEIPKKHEEIMNLNNKISVDSPLPQLK